MATCVVPSFQFFNRYELYIESKIRSLTLNLNLGMKKVEMKGNNLNTNYLNLKEKVTFRVNLWYR